MNYGVAIRCPLPACSIKCKPFTLSLVLRQSLQVHYYRSPQLMYNGLTAYDVRLLGPVPSAKCQVADSGQLPREAKGSVPNAS